MFTFSNDLVVRKYQYQMFLVENGYSWEEVVEMEMKDLRQAVDELQPITVTQVVMTATGVSKKVTKVA